MERRPKVNQGQNRNREIWLSGIVGGLVETCCNGLITICHEVGNDGYSGSYWPKTGVRHISISTFNKLVSKNSRVGIFRPTFGITAFSLFKF